MNIQDIREIAAKVEADIKSQDHFYETLKGVKDMETAKIAIVSELTGLNKLLLKLTEAYL